MKGIAEILNSNSKTSESDFEIPLVEDKKELDVCPICGEPTQIRVEILNKMRIGPVMCRCKREKLEKEQQEEKNKEKQIRLQQVFSNSLMKNDQRKITFSNWDHKKGSEKLFRITRNYAADFKEMKNKNIGLLIYGEPGNGKTYSSYCMANELLNQYIPVIAVHIDDVLNRIKQTFNSYGREGEATILNSLSNADLLILDDLGTEQPTEWNRTTIYNIIDSRYRSNLPLIITTNIPLQDIEKNYHKRTYDRILEMCTPVKNESGSIRLEKGKAKTKVLSDLLEG